MVAVSVLVPRLAAADSILFTGTGTGANSVTINASALFNISGTTLTIKLSNLGDTSGGSQDVPGNALTGLLFDLPNGFTLSPVSATIVPGSLRQGNFCDVGPCTSSTTNVGGEFRYATSNSLPGGADRSISSAGYNGGAPNFIGPNLDNPISVDGVNFGIIAPVGFSNPFIPNGGMLEPEIEGNVQFTMTIAGTRQLTAADFANVSFQYGTSLSEARIPGQPGGPGPVPEPTTALLTLSGAAVAVRRSILRRRA